MIVAGFGFRAAATPGSLRSALEQAADGRAPDGFAAPEDKAGAPCLAVLARECGLPVAGIAPDVIRAAATSTQAAAVLRHRGTGSVAEAAALAAAGPGARLLGPRRISADRLAACALAETPTQ